MSDFEYDPSYITPEQFIILVDIKEKSEFIEYMEEGIIDYNKKDDEIYFTEQNVIDYLCPDEFWDKDDKPNSIDEMNRYNSLESEWENIVEEAEEMEVDLSFLEEDDKNAKEEVDDEGVCLVCGDKNTKTKNLCQKDYNKIYYDFGEVTDKSIEAFLQNKDNKDNWSRDYDQCQRCYTTDREHHAQGYCEKCYYKEYHESNKKTTA